jgi:glutathione-independent formaldehyde dehydrogenase
VSSNRGVIHLGPGKVDARNIDFPIFRNPPGKPINHGAILKVVSTNICGSDQHMVRSRTTAPSRMVLGHEITGESSKLGATLNTSRVGDLVSVPFNVACGRCRWPRPSPVA